MLGVYRAKGSPSGACRGGGNDAIRRYRFLRRLAVDRDALRATERTTLRAERVLAAALRRAEVAALRVRRTAAFTLRFAAARRFFGTFGNSRRAPRTAFRAAPVATRAAPAAILVAADAALPAAPLIVLPAVEMMLFFAIADSRRKCVGTCQPIIPGIRFGSGHPQVETPEALDFPEILGSVIHLTAH